MSNAALMGYIEEMKAVQNQLAELEEKRKPLQKEYDRLRLEAIPSAMAEEDVTSLKGPWGRCTLTGDVYVSAPDKQKLHHWLKQSDNADLIVPTVNAQTLKAFVKEQMENGTELPDDVLNITPFSRAVLYAK